MTTTRSELLAVAALTLGCSAGKPPPGDSQREAAPPPVATAAANRQDSGMTTTISAADAAAKGLPAIGISVDASGTPMNVMALPQDGQYLVASGPPGGRLLFQIWTTDEQGGSADSVKRAVQARFTKPALTPTTWGAEGTLTLAGMPRPAVSYLSDKAMFLTAWCATIVPHPKGSLLIVLGVTKPGATSASCEDVTAHPALAPLLASFAITG